MTEVKRILFLVCCQDCHGWLTEITTSVPKNKLTQQGVTSVDTDGGISETFYRQAFMSVPMPGHRIAFFK